MWHKYLTQSERLQSKLDSDINSFHVWPANKTFDKDVHIILQIGSKCRCSHRIDYDVQCKHELKVDPRYKIEHWSDRWLTRKQLNIRNPDLICFSVGNPNQLNIRGKDSGTDINDSEVIEIGNKANNISLSNKAKIFDNFGSSQQPYPENFKELQDFAPEQISCAIQNSLMDDMDSKVTHKKLLDSCAELCRTVSNDNIMSISVYATVHEWISKLREGDPFEINF